MDQEISGIHDAVFAEGNVGISLNCRVGSVIA